MTYNPDIHHRHSNRLRDYDYSAAGAYFVTICTQGRECLFGEVIDGAMVLNDAGRMVQGIWRALPERFPNVATDEFLAMPNHVHGIIILTDAVGAPLAAPGSFAQQGAASSAPTLAGKNQGAASSAPTLGSIMRAFKSLSAIAVNRFLDRQGRPLWQRNYYERVIRDEGEFAAICEYVRCNPLKWKDYTENPTNASA